MQIVENGLIPIYQNESDERLVDARELHTFMEVDTRFNDWIARRIQECQFIENTDFVVLLKNEKNPQGGRPSTDYALSLDSAKRLAMMERNEKGKQARQYFIEIEKKARNPLGHITPKGQDWLLKKLKERFADAG
jgi:anti-repressor protein